MERMRYSIVGGEEGIKTTKKSHFQNSDGERFHPQSTTKKGRNKRMQRIQGKRGERERDEENKILKYIRVITN